MTTDRAGSAGAIGIAIDKGREGKDHSVAVVYWLGPDGMYVIDFLDKLTPLEIRAITSNAWAGCGHRPESP